MKIIKPCKNCSKEFSIYQWWIDRGYGKYCSRKCRDQALTTRIKITCITCDKEFEVWPTKLKSGRRCCSWKCRNIYLSKITKGKLRNLSEGHRKKLTGQNNFNWKGDKVSYSGLHYWVNRKLGKPNKCEHCKKEILNNFSIDWANKSREYKREITDWIRLCKKCHKQYDLKFLASK